MSVSGARRGTDVAIQNDCGAFCLHTHPIGHSPSRLRSFFFFAPTELMPHPQPLIPAAMPPARGHSRAFHRPHSRCRLPPFPPPPCSPTRLQPCHRAHVRFQRHARSHSSMRAFTPSTASMLAHTHAARPCCNAARLAFQQQHPACRQPAFRFPPSRLATFTPSACSPPASRQRSSRCPAHSTGATHAFHRRPSAARRHAQHPNSPPALPLSRCPLGTVRSTALRQWPLLAFSGALRLIHPAAEC
jgi:hypothetical protein